MNKRKVQSRIYSSSTGRALPSLSKEERAQTKLISVEMVGPHYQKATRRQGERYISEEHFVGLFPGEGRKLSAFWNRL